MNKNIGKQPELLWVDIDDCMVESAYQRGTDSARSQALIQKIANDFHWSHFSPIVIAKKEGSEKYSIIDGQHRVLGVLIRDDIQKVPALLIDADDIQNQAKSFVGINKNRIKITKQAEFHADIAAGDDLAINVQRICGKCDVSIPRSPIPQDRLKANQCLAVSALKKLYQKFGEDPLIVVLKLIREAYPDTPGQLRAMFIKALTVFAHELGGDLNRENLLEVVMESCPETLQENARNYAAIEGGSTINAMLKVLTRRYNGTLPRGQRIDEVTFGSWGI